MGFSEEQIIQMFATYAYQPGLVYAIVIFLMAISSFGFPAPEEITLFATGLVCYMGSRPDLYPPPSPDATPVNVYVAASICFVSVFFSDLLVFTLGRYFGGRLLRTRWLKKYEEQLQRVSQWTRRYGQLAAGLFRFTPGLRFPGHFSCGMMGLPVRKFIMVDGSAALISVPTQVLLVAFFGEAILGNIRQFKIVLFLLIFLMVVYFVARHFVRKRANRRSEASFERSP